MVYRQIKTDFSPSKNNSRSSIKLTWVKLRSDTMITIKTKPSPSIKDFRESLPFQFSPIKILLVLIMTTLLKNGQDCCLKSAKSLIRLSETATIDQFDSKQEKIFKEISSFAQSLTHLWSKLTKRAIFYQPPFMNLNGTPKDWNGLLSNQKPVFETPIILLLLSP